MPRSIRHLLAAALAVAAISMTVPPAFAADQPILTGTVLDAAGQPFPVENGTLTMTAPDGGEYTPRPPAAGLRGDVPRWS